MKPNSSRVHGNEIRCRSRAGFSCSVPKDHSFGVVFTRKNFGHPLGKGRFRDH